MTDADRKDFALLIAGLHAYHRQPCSDALIAMYWNGLRKLTLEEIRRAVDVLTNDPEAGKYVPKIGDITRVLQGTSTERARIAWGRALEAMSSVGAYTDVIFDDAAIHATVQDLGGWPKVCRTDQKELSYLEHRFCEAHKAYTGRGTFDYPRRLAGDRSPDSEYEKKGLPLPRPALVGDPEQCKLVYQNGNKAGKTAITYTPAEALITDRLLPGKEVA